MIQTKFIEDFPNEEIVNKYLENFNHSIQSKRMRTSSLKYFFHEDHFDYTNKYGKLCDISTDILREYHNDLNCNKDISITTKRGKWAILVSFLQYCFEDYKTKKDGNNFNVIIPSKSIKWSPNHKQSNSNKTVILSLDEIKNILNFFYGANFTHYLMVRLLSETGMRLGELLHTTTKDIDVEKRTVKTQGKTGLKVYYFSNRLAKELSLYLKERNKTNTNTNALFLNRNNRAITHRRLQDIITGACKKCNIDKNVSPHTFRRTLNTLRKRIGCDNDTAKILLGHKTNDVNIDSYTVFQYEDFIRLFDKFNPYLEI